MILKGVSKNVVEIQETGCEYFERALFFVKPEYCDVSDGKLQAAARSTAKKAERPPKTKITTKEKTYAFLRFCAGALTGAAAAGLLAYFF